MLAGCGALRELSPTHGEVKSMRTAPRFAGRGIGRQLLEHIAEVATERGYRRLSLETGTTEAFIPAMRLYQSAGFVETGPFGEYVENDFSRFFTVSLSPPSTREQR